MRGEVGAESGAKSEEGRAGVQAGGQEREPEPERADRRGGGGGGSRWCQCFGGEDETMRR